MGRKPLDNGFWTDFDGLLEIYKQDFEIAKKMDETTDEIDFINVHVLPQFEKSLKEDGGFPMQKLADKKMVDYLKNRVIELQEIENANESDNGNSLDEQNEFEIFANGLIQNISDAEQFLKMFSNGGLKSKDFYKAAITAIASEYILSVEAKEILEYCKQENVLATFLWANELDDTKENFKETQARGKKFNQVLEWLLNKGKLILQYNNLIDGDSLRELYKNIICLTYLEGQKATQGGTNKGNVSYQWQGNAEIELPKLHKWLIKAEMIDGQTDLKDFTATFTGQPTNNIKPIKWIAQVNLLAYFLWSEFKGKNWASITEKGKLFIKDGNQITANTLSSSKAQCMGFEKPPMGSKKIDEILSAIKKH